MTEPKKQEGQQRRLGKTLVPVLFFGLLTGALIVHVFSPAREARLDMLRDDHERVQSDVSRLKLKSEKLKAELHRFQDGAEGWREVARRDLGLIAPGEVVFRFPVND